MKTIKLLTLLLILFSCEKPQTYTCVCYNNTTPENYHKYSINNTYDESKYYCENMSNSQQYCNLSK